MTSLDIRNNRIRILTYQDSNKEKKGAGSEVESSNI